MRQAVVPIVLVAIVVVVVFIMSRKGRKGRTLTSSSKRDADHGVAFHLQDAAEVEREQSLFEKTLPAVLGLLFIMCTRAGNLELLPLRPPPLQPALPELLLVDMHCLRVS